MHVLKGREVRLLLINPRLPESFWSFSWAIREVLPGKRALNPPLGLATPAALCPPHWQVRIVDENVEPVPLHPQADLIGIGGMGVQHGRQKQLLALYRHAGYFVVAGGAYASLCPDAYLQAADTVIAGEAEYIWKEFCDDFERGTPQPLYRESGVVSLADSPVPRFDLLPLARYSTVSLQFSRGCPYRCEFCDIIVMFGRRPRTKAPEQIGRELDKLRALGARSVFFVDDNLIGDKKAAKALLSYLADYQRRHDFPFSFGTEASVNLARDTALLELFRAARFSWVFLGIETPDQASLHAAGKVQNLRTDLLAAVHRLYSFGIDVLGGFIVGFDQDDEDSFHRQERFIVDAGIQAAMVGLLTALPRTPLYERLEREGRLRNTSDESDNTKLRTNVVPKSMPYEALLTAYTRLHQRLIEDSCIAVRVRNKLRHFVPAHPVSPYGVRDRIRIVARLLTKGILPGGPRRIALFARSLPWHAPRSMGQAMLDWIAALAIKDYVIRHLTISLEQSRERTERVLRAMHRSFDRYIRSGVLRCSLDRTVSPGTDVRLTLIGQVDPRFFRRMSRHLRRVLSRSANTVTLQVDALREIDTRRLGRLLERLERYGERVRVTVREPLRAIVPPGAVLLLEPIDARTRAGRLRSVVGRARARHGALA